MEIRVSETGKFDLLLNGINTTHPTTYEFVCKVGGVPCMSAKAATRGRALLLALPKRNQLKFVLVQGGSETKFEIEDEKFQ